MCKNLPYDFVQRIQKKLDEYIDLTLISNYYGKNNSISKFETWYEADYFKGFIFRRVETDNVPVGEINSYLVEAKERISKINKEKLDFSYLKFKINNTLNVLINSQNCYLKIDKNSFKYNYKMIPKSITYTKDSSGSYFVVKGSNYTHLYDQKLNRLN
jgi:hypothetical protein